MSITGSINLSKINKDVLIKGEKGTYMNVKVVLKDEKDEYGNNGFIAQKVNKEQYEAGVKGEILGNIRVYEDATPTQAVPAPASQELQSSIPDDFPF